MTDGLKPKHRDAIIEKLSSNPKVERIVLFGSRAMGTFTPTSDVDIALFGDNLTLGDQAALSEIISELSIPQRVDLLIHHRIESQALLEHIRKHGIEWYSRNPSPCETSEMAREVTIGDVYPFSYGKGLPNPIRRHDGCVPVYGSNGVVGWHNVPLTKGPTVVIGRKGTIGAIHLSYVPCWPIDTTFFVEFRNLLDARFAYYLLKTLDLGQMNSDSAVPGLNRDSVHSKKALALPKRMRDAIAHILGSLDDKIELNRKMNKTLEDMARAIYKSWFVDFDPVRAKAEGRDPNLPPHIAALFPDSFEDSELGPIPKGWRVGSVGDHFRLTMGQSPPGSTYNETGEGIPFYQGRTDFGFRFPSRRVFCTAPTRFAEKGDTLVSVRAPVGDVNIAIEKCSVGRGVAAIRHRCGSRSYTYYTMHHLREHFRQFDAVGTVFGCINKTDFERLPFVVPVPDTLVEFDRIVSLLDDRLEINEHQSFIMASIRDSVLPKMISGELRLQDAKRFVGGMRDGKESKS